MKQLLTKLLLLVVLFVLEWEEAESVLVLLRQQRR